MAASYVRASDSERDVAIDRLRAAAAEGRLDHDELEERVAAALSARTDAELDALLNDLPTAARRVKSEDVKQQLAAAVAAQVGRDVANSLEMKQQLMNAALATRASGEAGTTVDWLGRRRETVLRRKTARFLWLNFVCIAAWGATGAGGFWPAWVLLGTGIVYGRSVIRFALGVDRGLGSQRRYRGEHQPH